MTTAESIILLVAANAGGVQQSAPQTACAPDAGCVEDVTAAQTLEMADVHAARGDAAAAAVLLRQLTQHSTVQIRSEARFRLAKLLANSERLTDAAMLLRQILDEDPAANPVRLALAQLLDRLGDDAGARRALREAQAGGLPPDVALLVDRYSAAMRARKPMGASVEIAIAPDSNINSATRSDSLGTVFGELTLDRDAREKSGIGMALRGQTHGRARLGRSANLVGKIAGSADLYRTKQHNDVSLGLSIGPELTLGSVRLSAEAGAIHRSIGGRSFSRTAYLGATFLRPIDRRSQLRLSGAVLSIDNRLNDLQDGRSYSLSLSYERALSARAGAGITASGERQRLSDPGYSSTSGQLSVLGYREIGSTTVTATFSYKRLEADDKLSLYPQRRTEDLYRASVGATFRSLAVKQFAPLLRVTVEQNGSTIGLFDYRRVRTEVGIARAF